MNIVVYSDESGVFDYRHNKYYVFGGLVFLDRNTRDICARKYIAAENTIRRIERIPPSIEVKASTINNKSKSKLFRSLNNEYKFGVVVDQAQVHKQIFGHKKSKQRHLDYVYKIALKRYFQLLISQGIIAPNQVKQLTCYVDEHSTATDGRYELREGLEQEFKIGTYNSTWCTYYPPLFPHIGSVEVKFCDSASKTLVRAADIVANRILFLAYSNNGFTSKDEYFHVISHP